MTVLSTTLAVALFIVSVIIHEAAHAYALRKVGCDIKEAGLGLPMWPRLVLKPTARRPYTISISPWIIGAYVKARDEDEEKIEKLDYWDHAWFSGAGVVANLSVGGLLVGLVFAIQGKFAIAMAWAAAGIAAWLLGKMISALLVPIVGAAMFVFAVYTSVLTTMQIFTDTGNPQLNGILGIGQLLTVDSPLNALKVAAVLSISLGLLNMLPLVPFDGGRICGDLVRRWWGERAQMIYTASSLAVAAWVLLYPQILDIFILTKK